MSRRERETEPVIGGGSPSGFDGIHTLGGGGSNDGSPTETKGLGFGTGGSDRRDEGGIAQTAWFAPVEADASPDVLDFGICKDGICPVPWASNDNPVFTIQGRPEVREDVVNHPSHYLDGGIECIEAIEAQQTLEEFRGYLKGNIAKYVWREKHKGGTESLKKARWYLDRLIELDEIQNG
jgi:hypothetical protein